MTPPITNLCSEYRTFVDKNGTRRTKHGMRYSSEYSTWISMRTRCCDPKHPTYKRYGGRGITLDPRWLDFHVFLEDMGHKPSKEYTLERVDNDKGYCKANCIWLLKRFQNRNQSNTKLNPEIVRSMRSKYAAGTTQTELAKEYNIRLSHVGAVVHRRCWKDL